MKLQNEFVVGAPLERTWETLLDVERVAGCLPGASIEPVGEDGLYRGAMRLKAGPVTMSYSGTVRLADVDEDDRVASFDARAKETKGTGTAAATIRNRLEHAQDGTRVIVETDLSVTGRPAQFGRGLMEDVAGRMLDDFAVRLERLVLEDQGGPAEAQPRPRDATPSIPTAAAVPKDEPALDMGSILFRGYRRQLGMVGGLLALALAFALGRLSNNLTISVRYER